MVWAMKPAEMEIPSSQEQDEFYAWVMAMANAESDGTPETMLINEQGEIL